MKNVVSVVNNKKGSLWSKVIKTLWQGMCKQTAEFTYGQAWKDGISNKGRKLFYSEKPWL